MQFIQAFVIIYTFIAVCFADSNVNQVNEIKRLNSINPIIRQLEIVSTNLNQLQSVLDEMGNEFTKMTMANKQNSRESVNAKEQQSNNNLAKVFTETMGNMLQEVDNARKVATELTGQLSTFLTSKTRLSNGVRSRRSVQLNEPNIEQLTQLIKLLRSGSQSLNRVRRQTTSNSIISNTMETASNGLQDLLQVATSLSNGIRRRLSTISTQIADLTANGVLTINQAATSAVQGTTNVLSSIGSSAVNGVNQVTGQISSAISNGVKQVNAIAQNTLG